MDNLHKDIPNDQIHNPKDFSTALKNASPIKDEQGGLLWENRTSFPPVTQFIDATSAPDPSIERDRAAYMLLGTPHANWDGASANDFVRYSTEFATWFAITPTGGERVYDKRFIGHWVYTAGLGWGGELFTISKTIASADVKTLFATPVEIVYAPVDRSIVVVDWFIQTAFTTPAYATEDTLWLITDTATRPQGIDDESLASTVSRIRKGNVADTGDGWGATDTQIITEKKLELTTDSANPTSGNSILTITVNFRLV